MREIKSKEEQDKKKRRNQIIIGVILIGLMVISTAGYSFFNEDNKNNKNKITYNGFEFNRNDNGYWEIEIDGEKFITLYNPKETEDISLDFDITIEQYYQKPLYGVFKEQYAEAEILNNIGRYIQRYQRDVCVEGIKCDNENAPVKNCSSNIMFFSISNETNIYKQDNCLFIKSSESEQIKSADRIIFKMLGVQ
ncbi:MAG: hypothetical protein WC533_00335 [Candidatus Pacearchaeota archaeon]